MGKNELIIYEYEGTNISLNVEVGEDTVWLTASQMCDLFQKNKSTINRHINNIFRDEELDKASSVAFFATDVKRVNPLTGDSNIVNRKVSYYNLDLIISLGYRVKSKEGIAFRKWANKVLKDYILRGYALNEKRLEQLKTSIEIMRRTHESLDAWQVLDVIETYTSALGLLDDYDHQRIAKPDKGTHDIYRLSYGECRMIVDQMHQNIDSNLFGKERDGSFKGALETVYSTYDGVELYPTLEDKAANLLYFLVKDHGLIDGNKRVASAIFLEFLNKNNRLFIDGEKLIEPNTLVAIVIMIAESNPREKDLMVNLIMNFLNMR